MPPPPAPASGTDALPSGAAAPDTPAGFEGVTAAAADHGAAHVRLRMPTSRQARAAAAASGTGLRADGSSGSKHGGSGSGGSEHGSYCGEHGGAGWRGAAEHDAEDEEGRQGYFVDWQVARMWRRPEGMMVIWLLTTLLVGIIAGATTGGALVWLLRVVCRLQVPIVQAAAWLASRQSQGAMLGDARLRVHRREGHACIAHALHVRPNCLDPRCTLPFPLPLPQRATSRPRASAPMPTRKARQPPVRPPPLPLLPQQPPRRQASAASRRRCRRRTGACRRRQQLASHHRMM